MIDPKNSAPLFSFAIIADTHITDEEGLAIDGSHATGKKVAGKYRDLIERVNEMSPAFVVHLGDITHPTPISPDYGEAAEAFHNASDILSMPYYLVPGNHDIGEKIHPALPKLMMRFRSQNELLACMSSTSVANATVLYMRIASSLLSTQCC